MEENIRAYANEVVQNDYNDLRHPTILINGVEQELCYDSVGNEEGFGKQLDEVFKNLGQESNTLLDDINNTREILYKLKSDAKDINDKIKNKPIQFEQTVKILDQDNLNTLNNEIANFDNIASSFNSNKKCLGDILDKKYCNNSYIKTYPSKKPKNYFALRNNIEYYREAIKAIKENIIALYDEHIVGTEKINSTLQRIKDNQNLNLETINNADKSCNIY